MAKKPAPRPARSAPAPKARSRVREIQPLLEQVLATLPVGVVVTDIRGDILLANAASKRVWGGQTIVSGEERWVKSKAVWHDTGEPIDPANWASVRALTQGETSLNELIDIETYDGSKRKTILNSAAPVRNSDGVIVGAVIVNEDVTERVRAEHAVRESASRLQQLSRRLLAVQEEERRHLSRELHDQFGQLLATITVQLHAAQRLCDPPALARLAEAMALLEQAGALVRSMALELRPTMLDTAGLDATLRWLAGRNQEQTGITTHVTGHLDEVSGEIAIACFRIAQEALTNVVRHAKARNVWIELSRTERTVELAVRDDGVGFDAPRMLARAAASGHLGLLGIRERVEILGGSVMVESQPTRGTSIRVSLPVPEAKG